ncbi:hypothetical protein BST97_08530 [Nonlabens spongiae]|uniref:Uncharacterized protein n=1 Tax=Nonlabens spongiae TaxID=331648 RepID=A0A1W6MKA8_9FLAO|nr:hypothetical protein [Nonlabens spongiae]ARN78041.1 hypothetical protein BST97_08530 [Nonlabens spongiae]
MAVNKQRKEVALDQNTISILKAQAEKQGRKLKNYMEHILREQANNLEFTDEYKSMMDAKLEQYKKGKSLLMSEEEFKAQI